MTILTPAQRATLTPKQQAKYDYGQRRTEKLRAQRGGLGLPMHIWIPDTQITPTSPRQHLAWAGEYVHERAAKGVLIKLILAGDWHDMESLSSYDRGKKAMENRRYSKDIKAGNAGLEEFTDPFKADDNIEKWRLLGNHEYRMERAVESDATLEGTFTYDDFNSEELGYTTVPFLETLHLDGVAYSHYFYNPKTSRPYGGESIDTLIKTIGYTFTQGHRQDYKHGVRYLTNGQAIHGLIAGAFYLHDEDYLGPQGNHQWRGIVVKHQVENGSYDIMQVSLDYLCRRYEGMRLDAFKEKYVK